MQKDPSIFLTHILESIEWVEKATEGTSKNQFMQNVPIQDVVIRRLEIIGEAVKNLPSDFKKKYPSIPWKKLSGLRDKLIHGYFGIDLSLVWSIVQNDIPPLKEQIQKIMQAYS